MATPASSRRAPSDDAAAIADLMVKHLIALVDHERLMAAVARAEDQAASLALEAISGRTISLATGIVMHQYGLVPEDAEDLLRRSARAAGIGLAKVSASVVRSGALAAAAGSQSRTRSSRARSGSRAPDGGDLTSTSILRILPGPDRLVGQ